MTTATLNKTKVIDTQAIEAIKGIAKADSVLKAAQVAYEERLLDTVIVYKSLMSDTDLAREGGVSKAQVGIYRRTGRILAFKASEGIKASEVAALVNTCHNTEGIRLTGCDAIIDEYETKVDDTNWKGAVKAINSKVNAKGDTTPKTRDEKIASAIKTLKGLKGDDGFSADQISAIEALIK